MDLKEREAEDDSGGNINQYPLDSKCYEVIDEIGRGVSAVVYKAICIPLNSSVVAIKAIDLERTRADLDSVRRESKIMTLLCHPNILRAHCSFTVESQLWVVMPFISCGSLQSIISSSFPSGLPEPCIATVLKETLSALSYLHGQGHLHRDIKAGNILVDSNGSVKLADFGVSASIYEWNSSSMMLTDVAGTPYWMAPEDPSKRPSAEKLLKHSFFKNCKGSDYLVKNVLQGLASVEKRYRREKIQRAFSLNRSEDAEDNDDDDDENLGDFSSENGKQRRISGWNFNVEGFELEPVFKNCREGDQTGVKEVSLGVETMLPENRMNFDGSRNVRGVDKGVVMNSLLLLKKNLDNQTQQVVQLIASMCQEESVEMMGASSEEQMIEELRMEVENEKRKRFAVEMELEFLRLQLARKW
ncbi:hypothetical protein F511_01646 [Dorcoceras hygrometricum]|nr:hypothetical protein F511_01646 [Dorcoceras hygrometricum]